MFVGYDQGSTDRGRTSALWAGVNPEVVSQNPTYGMYFQDDFLDLTDLTSAGIDKGRKLVVATSGSIIALDDEEYGVAAINSGATTDNQGATVFYPGVTVAPAAGKLICFEARIAATTITSGIQAFAGLVLATLDTTPVTAGDIAAGATDFVGFWTEDAVSVLFGAEDGGTQSQSSTTVTTLVDDTYVKVGFRLEGLSKATVYANGAVVSNDMALSAIPEGTVLRPAFACLSPGTAQPVLQVDWFAVGAVSSGQG